MPMVMDTKENPWTHKNKKLNIMINFDEVTEENAQQYSPRWPQISDYLYGILIVDRSGSGKTNALLNLINHQPRIDILF